jgi:hypothetical protein
MPNQSETLTTFRKSTWKPREMTDELHQRFGRGLLKIIRWGEKASGLLDKDTDLHHVEGCLDIADEIENKYPVFSRAIDMTAVRTMIYMHEAGELIAGDLSLSDPDYTNKFATWRIEEEKGFDRLIEKYIQDPVMKETVRKLHLRYENRDTNDPDVMLAHLIDMIQGTRFGLKAVFTNIGEARESVDQILKYSIPLHESIPTVSKIDFEEFIEGEINNYRDYGFPRVWAEGVNRFKEAIELESHA